MMYTQDLNGKWQLLWHDHKQVKSEHITYTTVTEMEKKDPIEAQIPGNFELDLHRAGLIEDPFYGENVLSLARYESVHLWYGRRFEYYGEQSDTQLCFEGIDTLAEIYLNGVLIGRTDNMFIAHTLSAIGLREGTNELVVHILPATVIAREFPSAPGDQTFEYNYAGLRVRKAAHTYGWDIMPRIVSAGLWRGVFLQRPQKNRIEDTYVYTMSLKPDHSSCELNFYYRMNIEEDDIRRYAVELSGVCGESTFTKRAQLWFNSGHMRITVDNPRLWWTRDRGEQNLYDVTVTLFLDGQPVDAKTFSLGIRTVELVRTSTVDTEGNGAFYFVVNGERTFIKGTNWVPADAFHSRDKERIPAMLELACEIGCNTLRCWGGNVYEDHEFFDLCDRYGLLVWQDFAFGCTIYPQDDVFCDMVTREVRDVVKKLRQHPSIGLWAGDNEVDMAYADSWSGHRRNPQRNRITREIIPRVLDMEDPIRTYLPSSPYIDEEGYAKGSDWLTENHLWGPRDYFKGDYYAKSVTCFASEMGYHGCNAPQSVARFITPEHCWPADNDEWIVHGTQATSGEGPFSYRRELMFNQVKVLFGQIPETLEEFALASQISQGEAVKFFIEMFRGAKWRRSGIIWWNLIDGWPQFSDAVTDYYFNKKVAFEYIKASQQTLCLLFGEAQNGQLPLMVVNDSRKDLTVHYCVTDLSEDGREVCSGDITVTANTRCEVAGVPFDETKQGLYLMEWDGDAVGRNHYLYGKAPFSLEAYRRWTLAGDLLHADGFETI